jgi:predicted secreted Zn-dependent protease
VASDFGVTYEELRYWNRDRYPSLDSSPALQISWVLRVTGPPIPTHQSTQTPSVDPPPTTSSAPSETTLVALPALSTTVWHASIRYFSISGRNPSELLNSAENKIPPADDGRTPKGDAAAYVEPVTFDLQPNYLIDVPSGTCTLAGITANTSYRATIPRWNSPKAVPPALLAWWKKVLAHIGWHEGQHVRIFVDYVDALGPRLAGQRCSAGQAIINQWSGELDAAQSAFDAKDRANWKLPSYSGPWKW